MDLLHRLHERLVAALTASPDTSPGQTITIGDLYQRLIPYRVMRTELGVMELAAYEHALLRLLGGEGGFLGVRSENAREEIGRELASVNPILGIYRDYADIEVTIRTGTDDLSPLAQPSDSFPSSAASQPLAPPSSPQDESVEPQQARCGACTAVLPALSVVRFCPFCGTARPPEPCSRCATPLEAEWNFCIRCGAPVGEAAAS